MSSFKWQAEQDSVSYTLDIDAGEKVVRAHFYDAAVREHEDMDCTLEAFIEGALNLDARDFLGDSGLEEVLDACRSLLVPSTDAAEALGEGDLVDVELTERGPRKIGLIKLVRALLGGGLRESKDLVDSIPTMLFRGIPEAQAKEMMPRFDELGASVRIIGPERPAQRLDAGEGWDGTFSVRLVEYGSKIQAIVAARSIGSLGLKAAKELVESAPCLILEGVGEDEARLAVEALRERGATAELIGGSAEQMALRAGDHYGVTLLSYGAQKIAVIKAVRSFITMGLKDAKDLVESAPTSVLSGVFLSDAQEFVDALEAAGASAEVSGP